MKRRSARGSIARAATRAIALTVAFGLAASVVGIVFSLQAEQASNKDLTAWIPAGRVVNQLLADMVDQETGERGYVITAQAGFLQPYSAGRRATGQLAASLGRDLAADPSDEVLLRAAMGRYRRWLVGFAEPQISDVRNGNDAAAVATEATGRGKRLFDALRRAFGALSASISAKDAAAAARIGSLQSDVVWLIAAVLVSVVGGAGFGLAFLWRSVILPIRVLERAVGTVSAEEGGGAIHPVGPREIASLAQSVEAMRLRLLRQSTQLREERQVVQALQDALLPRNLPQFAHFDFAARYVPAERGTGIGGDWYNVRAVGPHRLFVAVGDVAGRGLDAAALMASLRFAINAYAAEDPDPGRVLGRLSHLFDLAPENRFATVVACLFDADEGVVQVASAGHPSPVVAAPTGNRTVTALPGPPVGLGPAVYPVKRVTLPPQATIVLFSDGLVERRDEAIDRSIARLAGEIRSDVPVADLLRELLGRRSGATDDTIACGVRVRAGGRAAGGPSSAEVVLAAGRAEGAERRHPAARDRSR